MTLLEFEIAVASADGGGGERPGLVPEVAATLRDDVPQRHGERFSCESRYYAALFSHVVGVGCSRHPGDTASCQVSRRSPA
ncbi:hypothetical protein Poly21_49350 [Allorhodopirellula heiligendammensis]|uniref:Uncharacterized protein n=1 Tax=Allorhodopirellula heiligendammensis TaxID=2714739 RepID=A0A5C6BG47_9BACT|nr:hypothetical protein Poly21_49350 [Allorhodopirellula heiligendammensis]